MKFLNYKVACKSCLRTDGVDHMMMIADSFDELFENRRLKSEHQLTKYVVSFLRETKQPCPFCRSYNLEISDIVFDGKKAMIGQEASQLQLVIFKEQNGKIGIKTGGSQYLPNGFLKESIDIMERAVEQTPYTEFDEKQIGNVRFVVSTEYLGSDSHRTNRLEQFSFVGFSKESLKEMISLVKQQMVK